MRAGQTPFAARRKGRSRPMEGLKARGEKRTGNSVFQGTLTGAPGAPISAPSQNPISIMANTKSAKKAARQSVRRTVINKARRSRLRGAVRKVEEAITAGDRSRALTAMAEAEPVIIRAAQKNVVHRNAAQRKVSRLAHRIAALGKS
jgi:small subunit ribosomal protein S20